MKTYERHVELMDATSAATGEDRRIEQARLDGFREALNLLMDDDLFAVRQAIRHESTFPEGVASCCGVRFEQAIGGVA